MKRKFLYFTITLCILLWAQNQIDNALWTKNHIVKSVNTPQKKVALTFDDGPHAKTTAQILAVLKKKKVPATFFVLGENAKRFPQLLAQEVADGHEIGNHSYDHNHLNHLTNGKISKEITDTEKVIVTVAPRPVLFRPPGGLYNAEVLKAAQTAGYTTVLWTIDPRDWAHPPAANIVNNVLVNVKPGCIILLHDGLYPLSTPEAIGTIIDNLRQQGYEFVTVSDLLRAGEQSGVTSSYHFYNW